MPPIAPIGYRPRGLKIYFNFLKPGQVFERPIHKITRADSVAALEALRYLTRTQNGIPLKLRDQFWDLEYILDYANLGGIIFLRWSKADRLDLGSQRVKSF